MIDEGQSVGNESPRHTKFEPKVDDKPEWMNWTQAECEEKIEEDPLFSQYRLADLAFANGDYKLAKDFFIQVSEIDPRFETFIV